MLSETLDNYEAIILAVSHDEFLEIDIRKSKASPESIIFDIESFLNRTSLMRDYE